MPPWNPDNYIKAWNFASKAHGDQRVPGSGVPYINHIGLVAMEILTALNYSDISSPDLAVQCALLHDTIEDTPCTYDDIKAEFGQDVAAGVLALSKNTDLPTKREQMTDSLLRITQQPHEVWMVKMADRITNLQPPPAYWDQQKISDYQTEATLILNHLGAANNNLAQRLTDKIAAYDQFLNDAKVP